MKATDLNFYVIILRLRPCRRPQDQLTDDWQDWQDLQDRVIWGAESPHFGDWEGPFWVDFGTLGGHFGTLCGNLLFNNVDTTRPTQVLTFLTEDLTGDLPSTT